MNRQEFENAVSKILAIKGHSYFRVYIKGSVILAEAYEIHTDDTVLLFNCNNTVAFARFEDIDDIK